MGLSLVSIHFIFFLILKIFFFFFTFFKVIIKRKILNFINNIKK
jgi:hypothetical protein